MKIALIGSNGQLGKTVNDVFQGSDLDLFDYPEIDITKPGNLKKAFCDKKYEFIINCSAYTNVNNSEIEPDLAFLVNAIGVRNLSQISQEMGACLIHVSTDYVFDGVKNLPYIETDITMPLNVYGVSKLAGENFVQAICDEFCILRTSGLYGIYPNLTKKYNFAETMLQLSSQKDELKVVCDEILTPTFALDLARQIKKIIYSKPESGIYHATNNGECSWFEFAKEIFNIKGIDIKLIPVKAKEFSANIKRPAYSVLENKHLNDLKLNVMRDWKDALTDYLS
ncbi:MAG: dTDP-4-dehydrorhamnose reductase [Pseudomonadota bacterium]